MPAQKDVALSVRTAYQSLLEGAAALTSLLGQFEGLEKIFSTVPPGCDYPYIYYAGYTSNNLPTNKLVYGNDVTMTVTIVTKFSNETGGQREADLIANEVIGIIVPNERQNPIDLSASELQCMSSELELDTTFMKTNTTGKTMNRVLRFRHTIFQGT